MKKNSLLGDPKYEFTGCAPMSPDGLCMIFPKSQVSYSGNFLVHDGILKIGDAKGQEISWVESSSGTLGLSSCPLLKDPIPTAGSQSITINNPTEGDVRIISDYL